MSRRIKRLVGVASVLACACSVRPASGDSPVYADINGICGGLTPCYTAIQDAMYYVSDPDGIGPEFAELFVFPGTYVERVDLSSMDPAGDGVGDIRLVTVDSTGAAAPGTATIDPANGQSIWNSVAPFEARVIIDGFVVTSPNSSAIEVQGASDITIVNVVAHDAGYDVVPGPGSPVGHGIRVRSTLGDVTVRDSTAQNCNAFGVFAISEVANVTLESVDAKDNRKIGISARAGGDLVARSTNAFDNGEDGMDLRSSQDAHIDRCRTERNLRDGIHVFADNAMTIVSSTALENSETGFFVTSEQGSATLDRVTAAGHGLHGISVSAPVAITVTNSSCTRSGLDGFSLGTEGIISLDSLFSRQNRLGYSLFTTGDVQIVNAAAEECIDDGFVVRANGSVLIDRVTAVDQVNGVGLMVVRRTITEAVQSLSIRNSLFADNANGPGILLDGLDPNGSHVVTGCIICNNDDGEYGLAQDDNPATIDARGNWWGDVTGPKLPNKPGGLGDGIQPGDGEILVDPWIDQITAVASHQKATLADDVVVQFQFRHSGSEMFLGEGPGAVGARRPFVVTSDNGTVKSHDGRAGAVSAFITKDKGTLEVIAEGAVKGPAKFELSGLCFPARSVTIEVIPLPIPLPPNPTPVAGATPNANANEPSEPKPATPLCGAGVPVMAALSAMGLFAARLSTGSRRRRVR